MRYMCRPREIIENCDYERWWPIPGHLRYEGSCFGNVRNALTKRALSISIDNRGYPQVKADGNKQRVHRLVAAALLGVCPHGLTVNHIDGVKTNNRASNLEYVTREENIRHAMENGLYAGGKILRKLTEEEVKEIQELYKPRMTMKELAKKFGVSESTICVVIHKGKSAYKVIGN